MVIRPIRRKEFFCGGLIPRYASGWGSARYEKYKRRQNKYSYCVYNQQTLDNPGIFGPAKIICGHRTQLQEGHMIHMRNDAAPDQRNKQQQTKCESAKYHKL